MSSERSRFLGQHALLCDGLPWSYGVLDFDVAFKSSAAVDLNHRRLVQSMD